MVEKGEYSMLYARSLKDFQEHSSNRARHFLQTLWHWIFSTRFANHISIVVIAILFIGASSPSIALITPITYQNAEGMYETPPTSPQDAPQENQQSVDEEVFNENTTSFSEGVGVTTEDTELDVADNPDILLSNNALVKPYIPVTEEQIGPNPFVKLYTVKGGDALGSIADRFQVSVKAIQLLNDLNEVHIRPGRELRIPPPGFEGVLYTVQNGADVPTIVRKFGVNEQLLLANNEIVDPSNIVKGTELLLPGVYPTAVPTNAPTQVPQVAKQDSQKKKSSSKTGKVTDTEPPKKGTGKFGWPVSAGAVIRTQGFHSGHPGYDFASKGHKLIPIYASDSGTITHSGWKTGYGNSIIINHNNGYWTLYGHLSSLRASDGQKVSRGQVIGIMGSTGRSTGVHLHFEICTNGCSGYSTGTRINPGKYL